MATAPGTPSGPPSATPIPSGTKTPTPSQAGSPGGSTGSQGSGTGTGNGGGASSGGAGGGGALTTSGTADTATAGGLSTETATADTNKPSLTFNVTANVATANFGDKITYTYTVQNTGDIPLTGLSVNDGELGAIWCPGAPLDVGQMTICKPTTKVKPHSVTLADVAAGRVTHVATATTDQTAPVTGRATVIINRHPRMTVVEACPAQRETGEPLTVSVTITNSGDVSLSDVTASDDRGESGSHDGLKLAISGGDRNGNEKLDPGEAWVFGGTYVVADSPDVGTATVTVTAAGIRTSITATAHCTTQIMWGDEGCSSSFWFSHPQIWDGKGSDQATTTIENVAKFNATFGVTSAQSGLSDDVTLLQATGLSGGDKLALARYAATSLANADAGIAYRYRVGQVMALYRDAIGADPGPETVESVLAKPSAKGSLICPADIATRHLTAAQAVVAPAVTPSPTADTTKPAVSALPKANVQFGGRELMVAFGALQLLGLGGLRYRRVYAKRAKMLRRAGRRH